MWPRLLKREPFALAGRRLELLVLQPAHRPSGRRVVVRDPRTGEDLFDSKDCTDIGNAEDRLNVWLADQLAAVPEPLEAA